jgi:two-component system chemotaxis response regulator CheB
LARNIVAVGASAGGIEVLLALARSLPVDLPAAVLVVVHTSPQARSRLPWLLNRAQRLRAEHVVHGDVIRPGRIYVAPPNHHLLVHGDEMRLGRGPCENRTRPAIDPLFRSAARWHGSGVIGIVLSGLLADGTAGLAAIKMAGGTTVVQDPADAMYPSMPQSALAHVDIDHVTRSAELGDLVARLVHERMPRTSSVTPLSLAKKIREIDWRDRNRWIHWEHTTPPRAVPVTLHDSAVEPAPAGHRGPYARLDSRSR